MTPLAFGGNGGNGVPSASSIAPLPFGGSGGNGVPSADRMTPLAFGGSGGNGVPSACSVWGVPVVVVRNLVELDEGTINETAIKLKPTASRIFV
jgi:hypothetical protein